MRIGILSDTHDRLVRTRMAVEMLLEAGVEALFHCGDLTGPDIVHACVGAPAYFVFGNNDDESLLALRRAMAEMNAVCLEWGGEVTLAGKRIAMVHGHMTRDLRPLQQARPDYLLSGHSHMAHDFREGPTRRINPGALHRAAEFTVAVLDLDTDELRFLPVPK
ncbi:MAG: metallophosphatase family protein [Gemmataceae bacterium]|nr:metallophosphatase family protein [Gemmataceae bacterium]